MAKLKPSFLLIGPTKTGTTSAFSSLKEHSQIVAPAKKEIMFFDRNYKAYKNQLSWYLDQFPEEDETGKITFEATPMYFNDMLAPFRIKDCGAFPRIKFIMWLRNPVQRMISQYAHFRSYAILKDEADPPENVKEIMAIKPDWKGESRDFQKLIDQKQSSYVSSGEYIVQLKVWDYYFSNPDRFLILDFRDLALDFVGEMRKIQGFLGLEEETLPYVKRNVSADSWTRYKDVETITPGQVDELRAHYEPYNQELYERLGKDFKWADEQIVF